MSTEFTARILLIAKRDMWEARRTLGDMTLSLECLAILGSQVEATQAKALLETVNFAFKALDSLRKDGSS